MKHEPETRNNDSSSDAWEQLPKSKGQCLISNVGFSIEAQFLLSEPIEKQFLFLVQIILRGKANTYVERVLYFDRNEKHHRKRTR